MSNLKGTLQDASGNYLLPIPSDSCPIEESSTASQAYAVNDLFYYNNTLYKCTVAMVQGDTITPGTNCTATTTGGELSQLNSSLTASDNTKFEFCYDSTSGKYGYKDGADTFVPFRGIEFGWFTVYTNGYTVTGVNTDGTTYNYPQTSASAIGLIAQYCDFVETSAYTIVQGAFQLTGKVSKSGYYAQDADMLNVFHLDAGDTYTCRSLWYFGDFNPLNP